jgi:hypothetical protein
MDLKQIIRAEDMGGRAISAVKRFVENGTDKQALAHVGFILAEVRHFAVCWEELRAREDKKEILPQQAQEGRAELERRLARAMVPSRL